MNSAARVVAVTTGEPAGIGGELCLRLFFAPEPPPVMLVGDAAALQARARELACATGNEAFLRAAAAAETRMVDMPAPRRVAAGAPSADNAEYVLSQLRHAAQGCLRGEYCAMVTAPISKEMILAAGIAFVGQTEFLAEVCGVARPVMLLAAPDVRVALATTHLPLREVPDAITPELLHETLEILHRELPRWFEVGDAPAIAVCALNPHAGEGGRLGDEDQRIVAPAVAQAAAMGLCVSGPHPADTLLATARLPDTDCVLAMYHDQGLPALKARDFARAINITLGLPFFRASPDHGVALDIAARGCADVTSMQCAVESAVRLTASGGFSGDC